MKKATIFLFFFVLFLAACGGGNAGGGDPAQTVEKYLQAKVDGDADTIRGLLCADMEQFLERESHTFDSVQDVHIEGMSCEAGDNGRVTCTGAIKALYGTEETEFPLTNYKVVREDGEWKWCGETQ